MPAPAWQYHEPDHPDADFDALAEIYDRNMQNFRYVQGMIERAGLEIERAKHSRGFFALYLCTKTTNSASAEGNSND